MYCENSCLSQRGGRKWGMYVDGTCTTSAIALWHARILCGCCVKGQHGGYMREKPGSPVDTAVTVEVNHPERVAKVLHAAQERGGGGREVRAQEDPPCCGGAGGGGRGAGDGQRG